MGWWGSIRTSSRRTRDHSARPAWLRLATIIFLYAAGGTTGPELQYNGSAVTSGEFGGWSPIGAVQDGERLRCGVENGRRRRVHGVEHRQQWQLLSNLIGQVAGTAPALESFETIFNQDLNGDGVVGLNPHVIQTDTSSLGSTSLAAIGNNYFLYAAGGTTGPELQYNGSAVTSGEFGGWTPIGAVQTASGYDVAWKMAGADEYTVWSTDNNGNYISNLIGALSGTSAALESFETIFNQDLNGDGVVGLNPHVIQTDTSTLGSTSLAAIGSNYFLYAAGDRRPAAKLATRYNRAVVLQLRTSCSRVINDCSPVPIVGKFENWQAYKYRGSSMPHHAFRPSRSRRRWHSYREPC